jgi:hypothetical protein
MVLQNRLVLRNSPRHIHNVLCSFFLSERTSLPVFSDESCAIRPPTRSWSSLLLQTWRAFFTIGNFLNQGEPMCSRADDENKFVSKCTVSITLTEQVILSVWLGSQEIFPVRLQSP